MKLFLSILAVLCLWATRVAPWASDTSGLGPGFKPIPVNNSVFLYLLRKVEPMLKLSSDKPDYRHKVRSVRKALRLPAPVGVEVPTGPTYFAVFTLDTYTRVSADQPSFDQLCNATFRSIPYPLHHQNLDSFLCDHVLTRL